MWNRITTRTVSDEPHSLNNPSRCYTVSLGVFMRFPVNVSLFHNLHLFSNKDELTSVAEAWSQFAALTWLGVLWRSHSVGWCLVWDTGGGGGWFAVGGINHTNPPQNAPEDWWDVAFQKIPGSESLWTLTLDPWLSHKGRRQRGLSKSCTSWVAQHEHHGIQEIGGKKK